LFFTSQELGGLKAAGLQAPGCWTPGCLGGSAAIARKAKINEKQAKPVKTQEKGT
jgi:hypothetical protein